MKAPGASGFKITHNQDYFRNWEGDKEVILFIEDANNGTIKLF